jgi:hypothetical protein
MGARKIQLVIYFIVALIILLVITSPFLRYATWMLGENEIHYIQWKIKGSTNYEIKSKLVDLSLINGTNIITVQNGRITKVDATESKYGEASDDMYEGLTIEYMFNKVFTCIREYPRLICSFKYDSDYGFPTWVNVNCPNPHTCYESYETIDVIYVKVWK